MLRRTLAATGVSHIDLCHPGSGGDKFREDGIFNSFSGYFIASKSFVKLNYHVIFVLLDTGSS